MLVFPVCDSITKSPLFLTNFANEEQHIRPIIPVLLRALIITFCFSISLTGINIVDFMNISGAVFNLIVAYIFPVSPMPTNKDNILHQLFPKER